MKADGVVCDICHRPIGPLEAMSRRVAGWEPVRGGKGGGNALADRLEVGQRFAHTLCAKRRGELRRRGTVDQEGLL